MPRNLHAPKVLAQADRDRKGQIRKSLATLDRYRECSITAAAQQTGWRTVSNADKGVARGGRPDVTVVIVSYNTREVTLAAVQSIFDACGDVSFEVIVVDNDSRDGSAEALRAAFPSITVIASPVNGGYAYGLNRGFEISRGRLVLVLNPDTKMSPGALGRAVAHMDAHPEVGVLGARALYEDGRQQNTLFRLMRPIHLVYNIFVPAALMRRSAWFGDQRYASLSRAEIQDVDVVAGCFMLAPRRVIEQVGGLDERFFMYGEEAEWCFRIRQAGYRVRYHPEVEVTHYGAVSTGQMNPWKAVQIANGHLLLLRFTQGPGAARLGAALMLASDLLRALYFVPARLLKGPQVAESWAARLKFLLGAVATPPSGQTPPSGRALPVLRAVEAAA